MKLFIGLFAFAISLGTWGSSGETKTFVYDGSQSSIELLLKGEKTHTEYRIEDRESICYRTQIVGYRTVCTGPNRPGSCYRQPIYRQMAYRCIQRVRVEFEVKDYDVEAKVLLDVKKLAVITPSASEKFIVSLIGDDLKISVEGSKNYFISLSKEDITSHQTGAVKYIDALYATELIESAPILKALEMSKISLKDNALTVNMGPMNSRDNIAFSLKIVKKRALASDPVLFDRELTNNETMVTSSGNGSMAVFDLNKLGVELTGGKFALTAKAYFKNSAQVLNAEQFGDDLESSLTLIYKNR
jgi:hypothetical protein